MSRNHGKTQRMASGNETVRMDDTGSETVRMDSNDSTFETVRMPDNQQTVVMGDQAGHTSNDYISIGDTIAGTYELVENLAHNTGEATLFICQSNGEEYVAKIYHENIKPKEEVIKRIRSIDSPYVIPIIDEGTEERTNRFYEISPYYKNGDITKRDTFSTEDILDWLAPAINEGLQAIHNEQVVHRDIKPRNIFFSNDFSTVVLGDFGISSALNEKQTVNPTKGGRTSGYAAPEVYKSFSARESDYYSFGITLWELSVGTFPFIGMTDEQVMKVTVMDELHLPESMDKRLSHLIRGLTRKDRKNRWGYEEVKRWLNGEDVGLAEETFQRNIKPYQFNGEEIYTLEGLTRAFAASWEDAKKHLYRGLVREFIQQFGEDYALKVIECEEMRDQDKGLSLLIMQVNEEVPLCWKGRVFNHLTELGKEISTRLPAIDPLLAELLAEDLLLPYLQQIGADQSNPQFCEEVMKIVGQARSNQTFAYYQLAFLLNGHKEFLFEQHTFTDVDSLVNYLYKKSDRVEEISKSLINNHYFFAWLTHLGFEEHIKNWKKATS